MTRIRRPSASLDALVLSLLAQATEPLSAYSLSRRAAASGQPLHPHQIYRVLARLTTDGDVQRLEMLAGYQLRRKNAEASIVCRACKSVTSLPTVDVAARLGCWAAQSGFAPRQAIIEVYGLCHRCR